MTSGARPTPVGTETCGSEDRELNILPPTFVPGDTRRTRRGPGQTRPQRVGLAAVGSGRLRCCGRHFCGTRAAGRNATYRYYTCGGRQRYGRATCDLPADAVDAAVIAQLLAVFEDSTCSNEQPSARSSARDPGGVSKIKSGYL